MHFSSISGNTTKKSYGGNNMADLSEKELSSIQDILNQEDLLIKKFKNLSNQCEDEEIKDKLMSISDRHQKHFNSIYAQLK